MALIQFIQQVLAPERFQLAVLPFLYDKKHGMRPLTIGWSRSEVEEKSNFSRESYFGLN